MRLIDADALECDTEWSEYHDQFTAYSRMEIDTAPTVDAVEVVRCRDCQWYDPPHILHNDGTRTDVEDDAPMVTADVGINCGGQCMWHIGLKTYCLNHDREDPEDTPNIVMFRKPQDFCSYGERKD